MSCDSVSVFFYGTGASRPVRGRETPCILVKTCTGTCLLDCGEGCQKAFEEFGVGYNERLVILISHLHGDHVLGLQPLVQTLNLSGRSNPVYVIGPFGLRTLLSRETSLDFPLHVLELVENSGVVDLGYVLRCTLVYVRALHVPLSYSFVIRFPPRIHLNAEKLERDGVPPKLRRLLIEIGSINYDNRVFELRNYIRSVEPGLTIAYSGDTLPNALFASKCLGADILIHEATLADESSRGSDMAHSTISEAAEIAIKARAKLLVLTHLSPRYRNVEQVERKAAEVFPRVLVARKGLVLTVRASTPRVFRITSIQHH